MLGSRCRAPLTCGARGDGGAGAFGSWESCGTHYGGARRCCQVHPPALRASIAGQARLERRCSAIQTACAVTCRRWRPSGPLASAKGAMRSDFSEGAESPALTTPGLGSQSGWSSAGHWPSPSFAGCPALHAQRFSFALTDSAPRSILPATRRTSVSGWVRSNATLSRACWEPIRASPTVATRQILPSGSPARRRR